MIEVPPRTAPYEFLLALDEAIRPLVDAAEITQVATRRVTEFMKVSRCAYAEIGRDQFTRLEVLLATRSSAANSAAIRAELAEHPASLSSSA